MRLASLLLFGACSLGAGATFYVDPLTGSMSNAGISNSPWSTLEAVFAAGKTFSPGDVIRLKSGYHGAPQVRGTNASAVTIIPAPGSHARLRKLTFRSAAAWTVIGLDICPTHAGAGAYDPGGRLVEIQSSCNRITVRNCLIRHAPSVVGWTQADWTNRLGSGSAIITYAPNTTVYLNELQNLSFGIQVLKSATNSLIARNRIRDYFNDAIRGLADFCAFEYNSVINQYVSDANHDDCFQSWSTGPTGAVGEGTVRDVILRGNVFLSHTDADQPLRASVQAIGCFDGMFENWLVENNVISSATYHGIAFYGAINCRILNNTVVENPVDGSSSIKPWILVTDHKNLPDGSPWPVRSSGSLIRNNISAAAASISASAGSKDHNLTTTAYDTHFTGYRNFDFSLAPGSSAVNAGNDMGAPLLDCLQRTRSSPVDLGAYESGAGATQPVYASWQTNWFPLDPESGVPTAVMFGDGIPNIFKYLCGINPLFPVRQEDIDATGKVTIHHEQSSSYLGWTIRTNASAPDLTFQIESTPDPAQSSWQAASPEAVEIISRDPVTGDKTVQFKFKLTGERQRFFRLSVSLQNQLPDASYRRSL